VVAGGALAAGITAGSEGVATELECEQEQEQKREQKQTQEQDQEPEEASESELRWEWSESGDAIPSRIRSSRLFHGTLNESSAS